MKNTSDDLKVDFHCHFITKDLRKEFDRYRGQYWAKTTRYPAKVYDYEVMRKELLNLGVQKQVISCPNSIPKMPIKEVCSAISKFNDTLSSLQEKYSDSFIGLAMLPLVDIERSVEELDRCVEQLGLRGVCITSNIGGEYLDSRAFLPFFERAVKHDIPIFMHPTLPPWDKGFTDYRLAVIAGFLYDTTLSVLRLIFSGLFDKLPIVKLVVAHLGSLTPYFAARIDKEALSSPERCMINIKRPPSKYLKLIFTDTVSNHGPAYGCALEVLDHERLVFGTDYPWWDVSEAIRSVQNFFPEKEKKSVFSKNALSLLGINQ